ncbi:type I-B CRISPR-associated protein Cas5b [Clostridium tyrobutyricum]|uniref:type I-B CRISPR-associated protein Cas5b n=2 Tax=Clostridium tyrobutyricum TaxID=1519 RepID=UPI001C3951A0|nr:type I-B CRISPR-associated protein Cas5b [Clostridium tyrobutyricum]MBV4417621.1 type I-B CRISPR-associated protein Cas5b [Clostridium tyrobutyricum]MBV4420548.1 type I-B CRISPR-associated protein Cas5b [Clostridium tyrobutyricum]
MESRKKVLKFNIFQESACYKKPFSFKAAETYPLPPYSTIKGLMHKVIDADRPYPMEVSVQGSYESKFNSFQTIYFYKSKNITTMPMNIHQLFNVKLIIHVSAEEKLLEKIYYGFQNLNEVVSLGRREDLARLDNVEFTWAKQVDIDDDDNEAVSIKNPIYIPKSQTYDLLHGVNFRINNWYEKVNEMRIWNKTDVLYANTDQEISEGLVWIEEDKPKELIAFSD